MYAKRERPLNKAKNPCKCIKIYQILKNSKKVEKSVDLIKKIWYITNARTKRVQKWSLKTK